MGVITATFADNSVTNDFDQDGLLSYGAVDLIRVVVDGDKATLTGLAAPTISQPLINSLRVVNLGPGRLFIPCDDTRSGGLNRVKLPDGEDAVIRPDGGASFVYDFDSDAWRCVGLVDRARA